jgi:hypothetical protein
MTPPQPLVFIHAANTVHRFVASPQECSSYFGGPLELDVRGKKPGPAPLHQIANISAADIPVLKKHHFSLPLLYGMQFDGCSLKYHFDSISTVKLLEFEPSRSEKDWPYPHYPPHLPYIQLALASTERCSWTKFANAFPNLPEKMPATLVAVVPPPMNIGMSLWGRSGDEEGVCLVWEVDAEEQIVRGYNVCT